MSQRARHFSPEQIEDFKVTGYAFLKGFLSPERVDIIRKWTEEIIAWPEAPGKYMKYFEDEEVAPGQRLVNRIENFVPYHEGLNQLCTRSELTECLEELLGGEALLFKDKVNLKPPRGRGFTPHQDQAAGWNAYAKFFVSALVPLDENTAENGCLEIFPENYGRTLISEEWKPIGGEELELITWESVPVSPGDVLFFDSYMPHQSHRNNTDQARRNLYLTFNLKSDGDHRAQYYADKRRNYPPECEREAGKTYVFKV